MGNPHHLNFGRGSLGCDPKTKSEKKCTGKVGKFETGAKTAKISRGLAT